MIESYRKKALFGVWGWNPQLAVASTVNNSIKNEDVPFLTIRNVSVFTQYFFRVRSLLAYFTEKCCYLFENYFVGINM